MTADWQRQDTLILAALAVASVAVVLLVNTGFAHYASPWVGDSSSYIEAARSLLRGEPLLHRIGFGAPTPIYLWPPGYPMIVALAAATGLGVLSAAMLVTAGGVAAVVPAAYWAMQPVLGRLGAFAVAVLCLTAPGIILFAYTFGTEPVFLCVAILAIGCMARGWFFASGVVLGLSLLLRNSGLALVPALGMAVLLDARSLKQAWANAWRAAAGFAGPLAVLLAFNVLVVGTVLPYVMPPSTRQLELILDDMGESLAFGMIPSTTLADVLPWIVPLGGSVLVCLAALVVMSLRPDLPVALRRGLGAMAAYTLAGIAITVLGRLRYEWGAEITVRHAAQYNWAILTAAAVVAILVLPRWKRPVRLAITVVAVLLIGLRTTDRVARFDLLQKTDPLVDAAIDAGAMPDHPLARHMLLRQFFRHYEAREDLHALARFAVGNCRVVSTVFEVLITQYDIPATQPRIGLPAEGGVLLIDAMLPGTEADVPGGLPPAFRRVLANTLPPAIKVYTNDSGRCLPP